MAKILTELDELRVPAEPLRFLTEEGAETEESDKIIAALHETLEENPDLIAISAPQIGMNYRAFCLRFNDGIKTFINPIATKKSGIKIGVETCASMPGKEIIVGRPEEVTIIYHTENLKYEDNKITGVAAALADQQLQILDGVYPDALGLVSDIESEGRITDEDMPAICEFYAKQFLPVKLKAAEEMIAQDEESNKAYSNLKFTESVINGRAQIIESDEDAATRAKLKRNERKAIAKMNSAHKSSQKAEFKNFVNGQSRKKH